MSSFEFEGDEISEFHATLPSTKLEAPEAYPRGTYMTLKVEVRVRSVRVEEDRKSNLSRNHVLSIESVSIEEILTPAQRKALLEAAAAELAAQEAGSIVQEEPGPDDAFLQVVADLQNQHVEEVSAAPVAQPPLSVPPTPIRPVYF